VVCELIYSHTLMEDTPRQIMLWLPAGLLEVMFPLLFVSSGLNNVRNVGNSGKKILESLACLIQM